MKFLDVLKKVGGGVVKQIFPAAGPILDMVNGLLPSDKKLPENATGDQVQAVVNSLPPEQRESILSKQLDVQIEEIRSWTDIMASLATADASGSSTRPFIAKLMAWVVAYAVVVGITAWAYGIATKAFTVEGSWPVITAIIATPTILLRAYFGMRTAEKKARYEVSSGNKITEGLGSLMKIFKK